jgi:hypothetical protein
MCTTGGLVAPGHLGMWGGRIDLVRTVPCPRGCCTLVPHASTLTLGGRCAAPLPAHIMIRLDSRVRLVRQRPRAYLFGRWDRHSVRHSAWRLPLIETRPSVLHARDLDA